MRQHKKLTSQLQEMQEQMNSMNDSGEFQEVASNHSGRLSYVSVSLQWFQVLVPCWAATNACLLTRGPQENAFGVQFSTFDSHWDHPQGIHPCALQKNEGQFHKQQGRRLFSQEMTNKIETQFECRDLQEGRRQWSQEYRWSFRRILWLDSKDSKCRNGNSTNSLIHDQFRFGRYDSKIKWLLEELKSWRSAPGKNFPTFEMLDAKIASALNKIIQNSQFKKKVSLEEQKGQKEDRFLRGRQIAFHGLRLLSSDWCSWYCMRSRWFILCHPSWWEYSGIRYKMGWSSTINVKDSIRWCLGTSIQNWEYVSPRNSQPYWNWTTWIFIRRYRCPITKNWRQW